MSEAKPRAAVSGLIIGVQLLLVAMAAVQRHWLQATGFALFGVALYLERRRVMAPVSPPPWSANVAAALGLAFIILHGWFVVGRN